MQAEIRAKLDPEAVLTVPHASMLDEDVLSRAIGRRADAAVKLKELGLEQAEAMRRAGLS